MRVSRSIKLSCDFETAVNVVKKSSLLHFVAYPLIVFAPVSGSFPEIWTPGTHWSRLKLFGIIPFGKQAIVISYEDAQSKFIMIDRGYSALIRKWHHTITIEPLSKGECSYKDEVEVEAGLLTPVIWIFAHIFYGHRQKRWIDLCAKKFSAIF